MKVEDPEVLEEKAEIYGLLAHLFRYQVDEEFLSRLKGFSDDLESEPGWSLIYDSLAESEELPSLVEKLSKEHTRLFVLGAKRQLQPYESVQRNEQSLMMQKPWREVRELFACAGLKKKETESEAADHLSVQFAFMQHLNRTLADPTGDEDTGDLKRLLSIRSQLVSRLCKWVPSYCEEVRLEAKEDFYRGLALLTEVFLSRDCQSLTYENDNP